MKQVRKNQTNIINFNLINNKIPVISEKVKNKN